MPPQPTPKSGGLSLYANLLDPASESSTAPGTIAKAPVLFTQSSEGATDTDDTATDKQQKSAGSASPFCFTRDNCYVMIAHMCFGTSCFTKL